MRSWGKVTAEPLSGMTTMTNIQHVLSEPLERAGNAVALGALFGWIIGALPTLALIFTTIWGALKCVEVWQTIRLNNRKLHKD
jgi:hypothetical protein